MLTFTNSVPLPQVVVTDAGGTAYQSGAPQATDNKVTQPLNGTLPNGTYTVAWRVVSADGHPIKGTYKFTVEGSTAQSPASTTSGAASPPPPSPTVGTSGGSDDGGASGWLWIALAAVAVVAVAGGVAWARRPSQN